MNVQKIQVIRQAEQRANELIESTENQVSAIIRDANVQGVQIIDTQKQQSREKGAKLLAEYQVQGENQAKEILSELDKKVGQINSGADAEESKAIAFVKEQMKVAYGN